jgi:hypothetical protein
MANQISFPFGFFAGVALLTAFVSASPLNDEFPVIDRSPALRGGSTTGSDPNDFPEPDACVTLEVFASNEDCEGDPVRLVSYPTWSFPDSPCYTDAMMGGSSVSSQYCNPDTGNFHALFYPGSVDCGEGFWEQIFKLRPLDLTFPTDGCVGGLRLNKCSFKPCPANTDDDTQTSRLLETRILQAGKVHA